MDEMEQTAQVMLQFVGPTMEAMPAERRAGAIEAVLNGYARLALQLLTPADVIAMLRRISDAIESG